jgi:hypothetical protein
MPDEWQWERFKSVECLLKSDNYIPNIDEFCIFENFALYRDLCCSRDF